MMKDNQQPFTMKDLLDLLTARELESGEDTLRLALLNFNGLAGIYFIQHQHRQTRTNNEHTTKNYLHMAIQVYERIIDTYDVFNKDFHVDSFQLAHAYYNLSLALSSTDIDCPR
jgi:hypothetical protein